MAVPSEARQSLAPVAPAERFEIVDILRGFALLGILIVNMGLFSHPVQTYILPLDPATPALDRAADFVVRLLAEGKFYSLFSFLFGLGFTLQLKRAEAGGARFGSVYLRRLAVLLAIGLAHAYLIWVGDILTLYAVLGLTLLAFRKARPRTLLLWIGGLLTLPILLYAATGALLALGRQAGPQAVAEIERQFAQQAAAYQADIQQAYTVYSTGSFAAITRQRAYDLATSVLTSSLFMAPSVLAMFLAGLYFGQRGLLADIDAHVAFFRKALGWGLGVGLAGNLIYAWLMPGLSRAEPDLPVAIATLGQTVGAPALSLAYLSALVLLSRQAGWARWLRILAPAGRLALSNYLAQSIVCTLIFYSYGLGFFGQVGKAGGVLLAVALYLVQLSLSAWWVRRFRFGPAEWLWRSLTYLRWQPLRLSAG